MLLVVVVVVVGFIERRLMKIGNNGVSEILSGRLTAHILGFVFAIGKYTKQGIIDHITVSG